MARGLLPLQLDAEAGSREVGGQRSVAGIEEPIEQHALEADVIVKPLEVREARRGARDVRMEGRRTMGRQWNLKGVGERGRALKAGDPAAARDVGLQHID